MATLDAVTAAEVAPVEIYEQFTGPAGEAITAGQFCRYNTTTGKIELGNASASGEARGGGIALKSAAIGITLTALKKGIVDLGDIFSGVSYGLPIYLSDTDGRLSDTKGSFTKQVGNVIPVWGHTTADKCLHVDL